MRSASHRRVCGPRQPGGPHEVSCATKLDRKSGVAKWRDLQLTLSYTTISQDGDLGSLADADGDACRPLCEMEQFIRGCHAVDVDSGGHLFLCFCARTLQAQGYEQLGYMNVDRDDCDR